MRRLTLGTAGHIDHGKTALVGALTGVDTDRLPEEKRRGITIDLGFASLRLDDELELGIVDVPGHEAFVRNMLAGATGIDIALLVVAADEGVMPQTREHLAIIELLGIRAAVVALTKTDLAETDWLELVRDDVRTLLATTSLAGAIMVDVSARTGAGLDSLRTALRAAAATVPDRHAGDLFRMPIDRIFTVRGTGTVVTGTVWSGALRRDGHARIEPAGTAARVRGLQRHGVDADDIRAGERAAVALTGVDRHALRRGDVLLGTAPWSPASILTVRLGVIADAAAPVLPRQRVRVHLGTAEVLARVALPDGAVRPGGEGLAQLRLEMPLLARAGDRVVIRSYSPVHTIAGGQVLEPAAPKRKRFTPEVRAALDAVTDPRAALPAVLALAGAHGVPRADVPLRVPITAGAADDVIAATSDAVAIGDRLVLRQFVDRCAAAVLERLTAFHDRQPLDDGIEREVLRRDVEAEIGGGLFDAVVQRLAAAGDVESRGALLARPDHRPTPTAAQTALLQRIADLYAAAGLQAPDTGELPADITAGADPLPLLRHLERQGTLLRLAPTRWAHATAVVDAVAALRAQLPVAQPLGIAQLKDVLGLSRKHLIPLLEYLDAVGVTARTGETRMLSAPARTAADAPSTPAAGQAGPGRATAEPDDPGLAAAKS